MQPSTKVRPYVYNGINPITGEFYIGYREINTKPSHIDILEYRTSSKVVEPIFDMMTWQVLAEFETGKDAYDFEQLSIYENWDNPLLLNERCYFQKERFKSKKGSVPWNKGKPGLQSHSETTKEVIRKKRATQVFSSETCIKISKSLVGNSRSKKPRSIEQNLAKSSRQTGQKRGPYKKKSVNSIQSQLRS
jgi:hypothetical protein